MDVTGAVLRMNPVAEQLTGWTLAEAKGHLLGDILPLINQRTHATVETPIDRTLREGVIVSVGKDTLVARRDGTELPIGDSCAPIRSNDGRVNGAVLVFRDLTATRNAETLQAKVQQQLVLADRLASVGALAAGIAHEVNNPLTYVAANIDTAIAEVRSLAGVWSTQQLMELQEMLLQAQEGAARVIHIVRALTTLSRLDEENIEIIELGPVVESAVGLTLNEIRHRAQLVKDYGQLPLVAGDRARLSQVFINLLMTSARALPDGNPTNEIRVMTSSDARGRAVVEIGDNGPGIPPALLDRIFDASFTTTAGTVGTGLGLAISRSIVDGMGGELSVQSDPGRGTVFRVALPAFDGRSQVVPPLTLVPMVTPARATAVLVVDDEPSIGAAIRRVLRGQDVTLVTTAQAALDLLATGKDFALVLSDLMMPGMSGMDLYRELIRSYPQMVPRVVLLTGGAFTREARVFLDRVSNERMEKPFDPKALRELAQRFVT